MKLNLTDSPVFQFHIWLFIVELLGFMWIGNDGMEDPEKIIFLVETWFKYETSLENSQGDNFLKRVLQN